MTIEETDVAIIRRPQGAKMLVAGDFNAELAKTEGSVHTEEIVAALETYGLEDMRVNFLPRCKSWLRGGRTWSMRRGDRVVISWTDYLLGTD